MNSSIFIINIYYLYKLYSRKDIRILILRSNPVVKKSVKNGIIYIRLFSIIIL